MKRNISENLRNWFKKTDRKPVVLRGARQVGKTWLIRDFSKSVNLKLIELNFEREPELAGLFKEKSPENILVTLERIKGTRISKSESLLFLDEIQKAPQVLANLRWFYEEIPEMPVVATGSLLDFVLKGQQFSMPVGRISYLFMEPMSFKEFLMAAGEKILVETIEEIKLDSIPDELVHNKLMSYFNQYLTVGGMPAAVKEWIETKSPVAVAEIHQNLINTFTDDFNKYAGRIPPERLRKVMMTVPRLIGQKFMYSSVDRQENTNAIKHTLELLCSARICHRINHSAGRGLPLIAQENEKKFKVIFLDVGLVSAILGLVLKSDREIGELIRVNIGGISEQVVGQLLRSRVMKFIDPHLNYYVRETRGSEAEIDYLIDHKTDIIPVEVKSGATGSLKSLHQFMAERNLKKAVRINSEKPEISEINIKTSTGIKAEYTLISIPVYLTEEIDRFI
ncbi:MAG: ATP-binding protein [Actinobacteria bacterium]|nr:ATP-binding protein [Actinomycetota bacterium]